MTWVSDEPWAYVAYHHGRWHWSVGVGWFWIPGVNYSPAWVAWNSTPGYYGWAPLGYYNTPCHWGYGAWGGGYAWNVVSINYINVVNVHTRIYSDATIIRTFNGGTGGTTWTGSGGGGRDIRAPWQRTPLMVSRTEFHNPGQMQSAFRRDVNRDRLGAYERQAQAATGRAIIRRDLRAAGPGDVRSGSPVPGPSRTPFEDRRAQPAERFTPRERVPENRPADRGREIAPERRADPAPRERTPEPRPRTEERRVDPAPRDRTPEPRPRIEERRVDPAPRERTPEPRPRVEERRVDPAPRERRYEPQPERRIEATPTPRERPSESRPQINREERRPDPPQPRPAERESHPAPRAEAPRERPKPERQEPRSTGVEFRGGGHDLRR
jgi:hypothetical protein